MAILKSAVVLGNANINGTTRILKDLTLDGGIISSINASSTKVWNTNGGITDLSGTLAGYLPLTGGTLSGALNISSANWANLLILNRTSSSGSWGPSILFNYDGSNQGTLTMASNELYVGNNGSNRYKVWHENNDGSGSGLDADKLDGTEKADLLTAASLSADGNNTKVTVTVGGTSKSGSITVPYATRSNYSDILRDPDYHEYSHRRTSGNLNWSDGGLHYFLATSTMTTGKPSNDGHILHMSWDNGTYEGLLSLPTAISASMQWRTQGGLTDWDAWRTLLDSSNYSSYALPANKKYWANVELGTSASMATEPTFKTATIQNDANNKCIMSYDSTEECMKFTFA